MSFVYWFLLIGGLWAFCSVVSLVMYLAALEQRDRRRMRELSREGVLRHLREEYEAIERQVHTDWDAGFDD